MSLKSIFVTLLLTTGSFAQAMQRGPLHEDAILVGMDTSSDEDQDSEFFSPITQWLLARNKLELRTTKIFNKISSAPFNYAINVKNKVLKVDYCPLNRSYACIVDVCANKYPKSKEVVLEYALEEGLTGFLPLAWRDQHNQVMNKHLRLIAPDKSFFVSLCDQHTILVQETSSTNILAQKIFDSESIISLIAISDDDAILCHDQRGNIYSWNYQDNSLDHLYHMTEKWDRAHVIQLEEKWVVVTEKTIAADAKYDLERYQCSIAEVVHPDEICELVSLLTYQQKQLLGLIFTLSCKQKNLDLKSSNAISQKQLSTYNGLPPLIQRLVSDFVELSGSPKEGVNMRDNSAASWLNGWCTVC